MSLIVGLSDDRGAIHMAADSGAWGSYEVVMRNTKLFRWGPVLIGVAGSTRLNNVLRFAAPPKRPTAKDPLAYVVKEVVPAIAAAVESAKLYRDGTQGECLPGSGLIVGVPGLLTTINSDLGVTPSARTYDVQGHDGAHGVALGVLYATRDVGLSPQARLRLALEAAVEHTDAVRGPFVFETLPPARAR